MPKPLYALIPPGMRLRANGRRSKPKYVPADGHTVGEEQLVQTGGKSYSVRIIEEARHGTAPGSEATVTMAVIHRLA